HVHGSVHASVRDDVVNGFQEWFLAQSRHALGDHIKAPSAATVPRRQTFRRSPISAGLLCLSPLTMITADTSKRENRQIEIVKLCVIGCGEDREARGELIKVTPKEERRNRVRTLSLR
ncbi:hypothetical protein V1477_020616, partial [Vespula maculifrons]